MANMRKKRCRNPLCGRVFKYPAGTAAQCPFCRKPASRSHPLKLTSDELAQVKAMHASRMTRSQVKQLTMPIGELNLSVRAYNCLIRAGILTVGDITARSESEMRRVRNLGRVSLEEVRGELWKMGLDFKPEQNPETGG